MGTFSIWHLFTLAVVGVLYLMPIGKILNRAGFTPWLALLALVPFVNVILLWLFAFGRWPRDTAERAKSF